MCQTVLSALEAVFHFLCLTLLDIDHKSHFADFLLCENIFTSLSPATLTETLQALNRRGSS